VKRSAAGAGDDYNLNGHIIDAVIHCNPWTWIAATYGAQILGSFFAMQFLSLNVGQMKLPLALLLLGGVFSLYFWHRDYSTTEFSWKQWTPAVIYLAFIFVLSNKSFSGVKSPFSIDYFHPIEYAFLGIFLSWAWRPVLFKGKTIPFCLLVIAGGTLYGAADEIHQSFVPGRTASLFDLFLDFIGVSLGLGVYLLARRLHSMLSIKSESEALRP
jgi:VanZ family protein